MFCSDIKMCVKLEMTPVQEGDKPQEGSLCSKKRSNILKTSSTIRGVKP